MGARNFPGDACGHVHDLTPCRPPRAQPTAQSGHLHAAMHARLHNSCSSMKREDPPRRQNVKHAVHVGCCARWRAPCGLELPARCEPEHGIVAPRCLCSALPQRAWASHTTQGK